MFIFGSGALYAFRTDIANATPIEFGNLQECSVEFSGKNVGLRGRNKFKVAIAQSECDVKGKAKMASISPRLFSDLFFGMSMTTGQSSTAVMEAGVASASLQVANHATFIDDYGVKNASNGLPLVKVAAAPATGQYSVNNATGAYTFNAADVTAAMAVLLTYSYGVTGSGTQFSVMNTPGGIQPVFQTQLHDGYNGATGLKVSDLTLYACVSDKLNLPGKSTEFKVPELDFEAFDGLGTGKVMNWSMNEVS